MGNTALWLSLHEEVIVLEIKQDKARCYTSPAFHVARRDGSTTWVQRNDILLGEEMKLIDELAVILYHSDQPARHARYAEIMKQLLANGVPFVDRLQRKKPVQVKQIELYDVC